MSEIEFEDMGGYYANKDFRERTAKAKLKSTKTTNADRIRAMSDEEMAMLFGVWVADCDNNDVPCREQCEKQPSCGSAWLAWLKEEVKDGTL